MEFAKQLTEDGILVVKILTDTEIEKISKKIRRIKPIEFKKEYNGPYVLGGFGAFGHPSSFHHPFIKSLRKLIKRRLVEMVFKDFCPGRKLEMLFDRLCERKKDYGLPTRESWHQDVYTSDSDIIFGGWLNLDPVDFDPQAFLGLKGTQSVRCKSTTGFSKITSEEDIKRYDQTLVQQGKILVPPGSIILIQQGIVHCINPTVPVESSFRLFTGFRVTDSEKSLFDNSKVFEYLGVPKIPSGQIPTIYARMHFIHHRNKISDLTGGIKKRYLVEQTVSSGKSKGETLLVPGDKDGVFQDLRSFIKDSEKYDYNETDKLVLSPELVA